MIRRAISKAISEGVWHTDPKPEERTIGGVRCLVYGPHWRDRGSVIHFHGGAFRVGVPEQIGPFAAALAKRCEVRVICPAYRLAPEYPYPAALRDGWAVFAALTLKSALPILLTGDSAGGGLAASLALLAGSERQPIAGLALLSPWLDLSVSAPTFARNAATDPLFSAAAAKVAAEFYLQGHDPDDPLASPLFGEPGIFPATFINVGSGEVLLDDASNLAERLLRAGTDTDLDVVHGMDHVAVTRDLSSDGAEHTFERLAAFLMARITLAAANSPVLMIHTPTNI